MVSQYLSIILFFGTVVNDVSIFLRINAILDIVNCIIYPIGFVVIHNFLLHLANKNRESKHDLIYGSAPIIVEHVENIDQKNVVMKCYIF